MSFHVGQKVVCIEDRFEQSSFDEIVTRPVKGLIYTIRNFDTNRPGCRFPVGVRLVEIVNPVLDYLGGPDETSFPAWRFRPVVEPKTDISIFTAMLPPVSPRVLEPICHEAGRVR